MLSHRIRVLLVSFWGECMTALHFEPFEMTFRFPLPRIGQDEHLRMVDALTNLCATYSKGNTAVTMSMPTMGEPLTIYMSYRGSSGISKSLNSVSSLSNPPSKS